MTQNDGVVVKVQSISKLYGEKKILNDISFQVKRGESLGIIGKNGAGKSTLLKILAGVIKPSTGTIEITGSATAILDVGTGFHPDLSGRDNVYLVAGLLRHRKKDVDEKINKIIEFSELAQSIDVPVKNYSNGMYLRLAFSIYVYFNTNLLLLDEILAVGDVSFRNKILNAIQRFKNQGKTIILVSHNFNDILNYCDRVLYLDVDLKEDSYKVKDVINRYIEDYPSEELEYDNNTNNIKLVNLPSQSVRSIENDVFKLLKIEMSSAGIAKQKFKHSEPIDVHFSYRKKTASGSLQLVVKVFDLRDTMLLIDSYAFTKNYDYSRENEGVYGLAMKMPANFYNAGKFYISIIVAEDGNFSSAWHNIAAFEIEVDSWIEKEIWGNQNSLLLRPFGWDKHFVE